MASNLLSVLFISAIRADSPDPYVYFNFTPHDPCVYDWLHEVCPKIMITLSAAALVESQVLTRERWLRHFESAAAEGKRVGFDAHFKPDDEDGALLLNMLLMGGHVRASALRLTKTGSGYIVNWAEERGLMELINAQRELLGDDA
jgi:hypothetical protein